MSEFGTTRPSSRVASQSTFFAIIETNDKGEPIWIEECPGRQFALSDTFLNVASVLAAFDIRKPMGESTGNILEPYMEFIPYSKIVPGAIRVRHPYTVGQTREARSSR
ncbi:hypothetical protein E1B28_003029 [Marasmius oreades]|uniref:Uncharacterized protein n=1 Tax=Marasmius oreades TaxID=181124 RepID=A0A9P7RM75_9AGAR|nr:uncharacterized protein E1B28_003029 [Marasmius oreades]KAG7085468.1 hypothetical protein E1B28_003029 [Marasmius oreades]